MKKSMINQDSSDSSVFMVFRFVVQARVQAKVQSQRCEEASRELASTQKVTRREMLNAK